jgi:protein involved in polysaccharide export with SLBB domain
VRIGSVNNRCFVTFGFALIGLSVLSMAGCARGVYKPHELPQEFQPPAVADVHRLDLSRIAGASAGNDVIARGDVLDVAIASGYEDGELQKSPVRVGDDGWANVLLIGRVELAGLEVEQAEQAIAAAGVARGIFRNPSVTAVLAKRKSNRITVVGAVKEPAPRIVSSWPGCGSLPLSVIAGDPMVSPA